MELLQIDRLSKSFGAKQVLCGLDMTVPANSVFGFVGENGAGKTTTMKAILGLLRVDGGEIRVMGEQVRFGQTPTNRHIGYLPDVPAFYSFLTAREYLCLCGESLRMESRQIKTRSEELLELVGLSQERQRIKGFSRGMKQRLGIAQALLACPRLLICDEPTSALDPVGRREILDLLFSVKEQTTVLFSTHILSDVERICTDVALLHNGKIALQGSVDALRRTHASERFAVEAADGESAHRLLACFEGASLADNDTVIFTGDEALLFAVLNRVSAERLPIRRIERSATSLESLFLEVVKK